MKMYEIIETANDVAFQRLLVREQLCPDGKRSTWTVGEASVVAEPARHRTGIPSDATCLRYLVEHPEEAWTFAGRAVWRSGELFRPLATHVRIERFWDDSERGRSANELAEAVNEWLRSL
ncbi:hypothetical protein [Methylobacterium sp. yr668]|uniref:hypothetical protein n=1 Tax=Methylobacterium sp. yr668 TaxID=1761801 RepID=UPI001115030E|nr:hypothetical protein [Methylobacterium sp. yr668]